ncbi:MAG: GAF domain-containing protein [Chloroflexi bacterium]|nr:GAF domain-containing protein [Chloroflexota bacterium]
MRSTLVSVLQSALSLLGAPFAEIALINPETRKPYIVSSAEPVHLTDNDRFALSMRYLPWIAEHVEPLRIDDVMAGGRPSYAPDPAVAPGWLRSVMGVPLLLGDRVVGALAVASHAVGAFQSDHLDVLGILSAMAAVSINASELHDNLQRRLRETEALASISQSLTRTLDLDEVLSLIVQAALNTITSANKAVIHLLSQHGDELIPKALADRYLRPPNRHRVPVGRGIAGLAVQERRTIYVPDTGADQRYIDMGTTLRSLMCAPLFIGDNVIGSISVDSEETDAFSTDDERMLTAFAHSAALAIQNARMYSDLAQAYREAEQNQQQILESGNTLTAVFDGVADDLYVVGQDYKLITVNRALAARRQLPTIQLVGNRCFEALYNRTAPCNGCTLQTTINGGTQSTWTGRIRRGAQTREFEMQLYPLRAPRSESARAMVFAHDITERRQMESALVQVEKLSAVGRLAAGIAHEINNPMTVVLSNAEMMQDGLPPDDPLREHVELILRAGSRASKIVRNLLEFSGRTQVEFSPTDLHQTIDDTVTLLAHQFKRSRAIIHCEYEATPAIVLGNRDQLQVVWINLLVNALDALSERAADRQIQIHTSNAGDHAMQITINDNGKGVPGDAIPHLFEPFFTTKAPGEGTGLGLYNCYNIIRQHGGDMRVASQINAGTTFTISLPTYP